MKLSFVVPVVRPELHMVELLNSLNHSCSKLNNIELIVINQSQSTILDLLSKLSFPVQEVITESIIPAAEARNLGANYAKGEFLFFLDDDALLIAERDDVERLLKNLELNIDAGLCHRGEILNGKYITHWPSDIATINQRNFSKYCIEWNVIIRKNIFLKYEGFPNIGAGSRHAALSGEMFVLMARLLGGKIQIHRFNYIRVAHPALLKNDNSASNLLGYFYGAGYSVGTSLKYLSLLSATYWLLRSISASVADFLFRYRLYSNSTSPKIKRIGFALLFTRIVGLLNGVRGNKIIRREWLSSLVEKCL
jgi:glycosyltransferase involved in cell wall biosynthesis